MVDISHWPIQDKLSFPDYVYGSRWVLGRVGAGAEATPDIHLLPFALPEWCIIWELHINYVYGPSGNIRVTFKLSDHEPTTPAEYESFEDVFQCLWAHDELGSSVSFEADSSFHLTNLKIPLHAAGRRFCVSHHNDTDTPTTTQYAITISSIPTEVPEWLISADRKSHQL